MSNFLKIYLIFLISISLTLAIRYTWEWTCAPIWDSQPEGLIIRGPCSSSDGIWLAPVFLVAFVLSSAIVFIGMLLNKIKEKHM